MPKSERAIEAAKLILETARSTISDDVREELCMTCLSKGYYALFYRLGEIYGRYMVDVLGETARSPAEHFRNIPHNIFRKKFPDSDENVTEIVQFFIKVYNDRIVSDYEFGYELPEDNIGHVRSALDSIESAMKFFDELNESERLHDLLEWMKENVYDKRKRRHAGGK